MSRVIGSTWRGQTVCASTIVQCPYVPPIEPKEKVMNPEDEYKVDFKVVVHQVDQGMGRGHNRITVFEDERETSHIVWYKLTELQMIADEIQAVLDSVKNGGDK